MSGCSGVGGQGANHRIFLNNTTTQGLGAKPGMPPEDPLGLGPAGQRQNLFASQTTGINLGAPKTGGLNLIG